MANTTIVWTATALKQRRLIFTYWNKRNHSTNYSKNLLLAIQKRMDLLAQFPEMGKPTNYPNTKVIAMEHYSIFYQVQKSIVITCFWDNRQNPDKLVKMLN